MSKITAMTIATSLTAGPTATTIDALTQNIEEPVLEENNLSEKDGVETLTDLTGVVMVDNVEVKLSPDILSETIGTLKFEDTISILSFEGDSWYKINYQGNISYIQNDYIRVNRATVSSYSVTTMSKDGQVVNVSSNDYLNVRSAPNTKGSVLYKLSNGTKVKITGKVSNGWYRIQYNSKEGFVSGSYLKEITTTTTTTTTTNGKVVNVVSNDTLNVRSTASTKGTVLYRLKNGTAINIIQKQSNGWYKISYNGTVGYASGSYIAYTTTSSGNTNTGNTNTGSSTTASTQYKVTAPINLRKTASWTGQIVKVVYTGDIVNVISISNGWAKIDLNGTTVYAPSNYLEKTTTSTPSTPEVEVKPETTPSTPDSDTTTPDSGTTTPETPSEPETPETSGETPDGLLTIDYRITGDVYFRDSASWSANKGRIIYKDEVVKVVNYGDTWSKIYENGKYGYVPSTYVEKVNSNDETPEETLKNVTYTNYNMTMSAYIAAQKSANPKSYSTSYFEQYINPDKCNNYEFLEINKFREINVDRLNELLEQNNAGVLKGQGQAIYDAAQKHNIDPLYFISQSIHETGYGKSTLAKGVTITEIADENYPIKDSNGNITGYKMIQLDEPVTVYNLYGIGAKDNLSTMPNRALVLGTTKAYNEGWTSVEKAIEGAAKFVSDGYINNTKYNQNTIYKMRYNPNQTYIWHQYATSPWYSRDISALMEKFETIYESGVELTYDKPKFN